MTNNEDCCESMTSVHLAPVARRVIENLWKCSFSDRAVGGLENSGWVRLSIVILALTLKKRSLSVATVKYAKLFIRTSQVSKAIWSLKYLSTSAFTLAGIQTMLQWPPVFKLVIQMPRPSTYPTKWYTETLPKGDPDAGPVWYQVVKISNSSDKEKLVLKRVHPQRSLWLLTTWVNLSVC